MLGVFEEVEGREVGGGCILEGRRWECLRRWVHLRRWMCLRR